MKMLAFDCETQGFDSAKHRITEMGAIIFDADTKEELGRANFLVYDETYVPQSEEIVGLTGITTEMLQSEGVPFEEALRSINALIGQHGGISHFVAHNAPFDKRMFVAELLRMNNAPETVVARYRDIPWICTLKDVKHPEKFKSRKLSHLALDYGVAVDPSKLHRAVADCSLMLDMLRAAKVDLLQVADRAKAPDVIIRAIVPSPFGPKGDNGVGKDKAKACGFSYGKIDEFTLPQAWLKKVKENEIEQEEKALGYQVRIVG